MSKKFVVGKQYKLVDASLSHDLKSVIDDGLLVLPSVFTCNHVDAEGDCYSTTTGVTWRGCGVDVCDEEGWMCAAHDTLEAGAIVEVTT